MTTSVHQSEQINELAAALATAQATIENAPKDRENPHFRSRYADLASILGVCRRPLAENGLAVVQAVSGDYDRPTLRTTLMHRSGQWIAGEVPLNGDLSKPQALGSLITYMRRYTLAAIVGVAQEDDDANDAQAGAPQYGNGRRAEVGSYQPSQPPPPRREEPRRDARPAGPAPQSKAPANLGDYPGPDMSRKPTSGKGLYAWSKQAGEQTGFDWTGQMIAIGKQMGFPGKTYDWEQHHVDAVWNRILEFLDDASGRPSDPEPAGAMRRDFGPGTPDDEAPF